MNLSLSEPSHLRFVHVCSHWRAATSVGVHGARDTFIFNNVNVIRRYQIKVELMHNIITKYLLNKACNTINTYLTDLMIHRIVTKLEHYS